MLYLIITDGYFTKLSRSNYRMRQDVPGYDILYFANVIMSEYLIFDTLNHTSDTYYHKISYDSPPCAVFSIISDNVLIL